MMLMYALEGRGKIFTLGFSAGCGLSSIFGFLAGAWPFGIVEVVWAEWPPPLSAPFRHRTRTEALTLGARRPRSFPWDSFP